MGVKLMRILSIAIAAAVLALPSSAPARASGGTGLHSVHVATADYSADTKKKKPPQKKEKVEYMRAAPMK
jgi:hypothetical protein